MECSSIDEVQHEPDSLTTLVEKVHKTFETYVKLNKRIPPEMQMTVSNIVEPSKLADTVVAHLNLKLNDRQMILETEDPKIRLERLIEFMEAEIEILQVERKIRSRVKKQMEKNQKEYYLNEQMQAIQKELGERDELKNDLAELEARILAKKMSAEATERVNKEFKKLKMMSPMSAEATVVRNYIDWILSLPWYDKTDSTESLTTASDILDEDHYGLAKPKERILEYLAVEGLVEKLEGPILCLVGSSRRG